METQVIIIVDKRTGQNIRSEIVTRSARFATYDPPPSDYPGQHWWQTIDLDTGFDIKITYEDIRRIAETVPEEK